MKTFTLVLALVMYVLVILFPHRKSWLSLAAAAVLLAAGVVGPMHALAELVNWDILMIYLGCLVIAELFIYSGVPAALAERIVRKAPTLGLAVVAILVLTGFISAFVENVATVLVMAPIAMEISRRVRLDPRPFLIGLAVMAKSLGLAPELFMFGLLIGSCLGGNLTPFGASANIVAVGILKKEGRKVDFLDWTRICLPFTVLTTAASALFVHFLWR